MRIPQTVSSSVLSTWDMLMCKCFALHELAEFQSYEEAFHKVHGLCSLWYGMVPYLATDLCFIWQHLS